MRRGSILHSHQPRLVFVIVDASSAAYALNKGRVGEGSSADMQQVMTDITDLLATHYMDLGITLGTRVGGSR